MKFNESKIIETGTGKWTVTVEGDQWKEILKKAKNKVKANLEIPGFRKGKAPESEVNKFLTPTKIYNEAFRLSISKAFDFAREQTATIEPFNAPEPRPVKVNEELLVIDFIFELKPEIKIGQYKGITSVEKEVIEITPIEIDQAIEEYRQKFALEKDKTSAIANGDVVKFDFKGLVDGVEFAGGSAQDFSLVIGSGQFIPGFETSMIGKTIGSDQSIMVQFPENYTPELAGKDAEFILNIKEIKERILPEIDDELVKDINIKGIETLAQLKTKINDDILNQKTNVAKTNFVDAIIAEIIKTSEINLPETLIKRQIKDMKKEFEDEVIRQGLTLKAYKKASGLSDEQIETELSVDAKEKLSTFLISAEIIKQEKIIPTQADIDNKAAQLAIAYNLEVDYIKQILPMDSFKSEIENELLSNFIFENNGK